MTTASAPHRSALTVHTGPHRRRLYLPAAAGAAYLAAWAVGLSAWPSNLALNATNAQTAAAYRAHSAGAVVQYLLVEGLAGLLLAVVLGFALLPVARRRPPRLAAGLAAAAVVLSLAQCVLGLVVVATATSAEVTRAGSLSALDNRLDGAKMLALAGVAAYLAVTRSPARSDAVGGPARGTAARAPSRTPARIPVRGAAGPWPRWLRAIALLAALSLASSAVAYLFLSNTLAWTAYLSGSFLLLWIAATGIWLTATARGNAVSQGAGD
jgi:hypothetical protein